MASTDRNARPDESSSAHTPLWLRLPAAQRFPVQAVKNDGLGYVVPVFDGWQTVPAVESAPTQEEHIYRGSLATQWLILSHMRNAVPGHDMNNWVNVFVTLLGFPAAQVAAQVRPEPALITWRYQGSVEPYRTALQVDEMHAYVGSAKVRDDSARLYLVMMRRGHLAWKLFLSVDSNWGAGMDELLVMREDHSRAGEVFGGLQLQAG